MQQVTASRVGVDDESQTVEVKSTSEAGHIGLAIRKESHAPLVEGIRHLQGVESAALWTRVQGKERIYVDLTKHNGGRKWNVALGTV